MATHEVRSTRPSPGRRTRTTLRRPGVDRPRPLAPSVTPPAPPADPSGRFLRDRPVAPPVTITTERTVEGELAEVLHAGYAASVGPLAELAVLRHVDPRETVLGWLADPRITKLVAWQGGEPVGLGLVTNQLHAVDEISPEFLRARFPEHAARDAIYVGMLVLVLPGVRGMTVFSRIYNQMWNIPAQDAGLLVFDVCEFNRVMFGTDELTERIAGNFPHASVEVLDRQTWYVAHLPEPLPGTARR